MSSPRKQPASLFFAAACVLAVAQAAWCAAEWAERPARWLDLPGPAAWAVGAIALAVLALAPWVRRPEIAAALSAAIAAAGLLLVDARGRAWSDLLLPAGLWSAYLFVSLDFARWNHRLRGAGAPASIALRPLLLRIPLFLGGGIALGWVLGLLPLWGAGWIGGARWSQGIEAGSAITLGLWTLAACMAGWTASRLRSARHSTVEGPPARPSRAAEPEAHGARDNLERAARPSGPASQGRRRPAASRPWAGRPASEGPEPAPVPK